MENGLFGEDFDITIPETNVKDLVKKAKAAKAEEKDPSKVLKSKKLDLKERLEVIMTNVLRILGHRRYNTLVIKDRKTLDEYIDAAIASGTIAIDTETNNSLDPVTCKLMGPCFHYPGGKQAYVPVNHRNYETKERLDWQLTEQDCKEVFEKIAKSGVYVLMHNGKFDYEVIKCTCGVKVKPDWDTMICARLLNENEPASLKKQYIMKIDPDQEKYDIDHLFENVAYADVDPNIFALYASQDALMTSALYELQKKELDKPEYGPHMDLTGKHEVKGLRWLFHEVEMPIVVVTAEMELKGVKIDAKLGQRLKDKYNGQLEEIDSKISKMLGKLSPLIERWKLSAEANEKTKIYVPAKTKMAQDKIEKTYPLVDAEGNRYKVGKTKIEQLETPINLASPTQLAVLFYDILKCPSVSKKNPRATGEGELKELAEAMNDPKTASAMAKRVAACLLSAKPIEQTVIEKDTDPDSQETDLFEGLEDLEEDFGEQEEKNIDVSAVFDAADPKNIEDNFIMLAPVISELMNSLLKRRGIVKLITTYIDVIPELAKHWPDGRIRFTLRSVGTGTGRYSSGGTIKYWDEEKDMPIEMSGINIQNQPARGNGLEIRALYKAEVKKGKIEEDDDGYFIIPEITEVETANGYRYCKDLVVGDELIVDGMDMPIQKIGYCAETKEYCLII